MLQVLEFVAVISGALFGVLLARSKGMDVIGVFAVAFAVAFGGGTLRDVLLDRAPLFWIQNEHYVWTVFGIAFFGAFVPRFPRRFERWLEVPDAIGLALFGIVGAGVASRYDMTWFLAVLFGVVTATFGGVIADIICNDLPRLFRPTTQLYASCAFVGAALYMLLRGTVLGEAWAQGLGVIAVLTLRFVALRFDLRLPASPA